MKEKVIVISLGGSLIVPEEIDYSLLKKFKEILKNNYKKYRFVVVCGGGSIARKYIEILRKQGKSKREQGLAGIRATKMNARFMMQFTGDDANDNLPTSMKKVETLLSKNKVVFLGALQFRTDQTTDASAAKLARFFKSDFINITNIQGLYTSNPKIHKNAKFIPRISWEKFEEMALKLTYQAGQHFVLDQNSAKYIKKHKIRTYVIGPKLENLNKILKGEKFTGTVIGK